MCIKLIKNYSYITCTYLVLILLTLSVNLVHAQSLAREKLGGVSIDTSLAYVIQDLGKADHKSKELYDEYAHCWVRVHYFEKAGIEVEVCRAGRNYNVRSVRAVKSEIARTSKGLGVGSTSSAIVRSYHNARVIENHTIVVEDRVRGIVLQFLLENKKVYEVNLYRDESLISKPKVRTARRYLFR